MNLKLVVPPEVRDFYQTDSFENYPLVKLNSGHVDSRGCIQNIVDGNIGDVAWITSVRGSTRASHVHKTDWHFTFIVSGELVYTFSHDINPRAYHQIQVSSNNLIFTPPNVFHKMEFNSDTEMIVVSRNSRQSRLYEADTIRIRN